MGLKIDENEFKKCYEYLAHDCGFEYTEKSKEADWLHILKSEKDKLRYKQIIIEIAKMREEIRSFETIYEKKEDSSRINACSFEIAFSLIVCHSDYICKL